MLIETRPIVIRVRLRGGLTLKVMETEDGGLALWCTRAGGVVRLLRPPLV